MSNESHPNKLHIVYNICGISGRDNTDYYFRSLDALVDRSIDNSRLVVSACRPVPGCVERIKARYGDKLSVNWIESIVPVNISFNLTVQEVVKRFGTADGYAYLDSGVICSPNTHKNLHETLLSGPYGIVSAVVNEDFCQWYTYDLSKPTSQIPVGQSINGHTEVFSNRLYQYYNHKLMPDIFAKYCTESVYTFLCAALNLNWVILSTENVHHERSMDGASAGFNDRHNLFGSFSKEQTIESFVHSDTAKRLGLGYEECHQAMMHDQSQFDENGFCINNDLREYIRQNLYLRANVFSYKDIIYDFMG